MPPLILIAEDDAFLRETIQLSLEEHGVTVTVAADGQEAVEALERQAPDLLLLDLLMPVRDGLFVLQHIQDQGHTFPVIILSNLSGDMTPEKCFALGAKDYLVKSDMDENELWPRVQKFL